MAQTNYEKFDPAKIALFDLDGTLADFDGAMREGLKKIMGPMEGLPDDIGPDHAPWFRERKRLVKNQPGWWENLPRFQPGWDILDMTRKLGFDVSILTKGPYNTTAAWTEKVNWCRRELPGTKVTITEDKSTAYGRVLVDDWPEYIDPWLANRPRGVVIVPAHPWNTPARLADISLSPTNRIVRYDGKNMGEVVAALTYAFNRR